MPVGKTFLAFVERENPGRRTRRWEVRSASGSHRLGAVRWWAAWRRYCFFPEEGVLLDPACLRELADFVEGETVAHRAPAG